MDFMRRNGGCSDDLQLETLHHAHEQIAIRVEHLDGSARPRGSWDGMAESLEGREKSHIDHIAACFQRNGKKLQFGARY